MTVLSPRNLKQLHEWIIETRSIWQIGVPAADVDDEQGNANG